MAIRELQFMINNTINTFKNWNAKNARLNGIVGQAENRKERKERSQYLTDLISLFTYTQLQYNRYSCILSFHSTHLVNLVTAAINFGRGNVNNSSLPVIPNNLFKCC